MKLKFINIVTLSISLCLLTFQSCTQEDNTTFSSKSTDAIPVATSPEVNADGTVFFTGSTVDLKWSADNKGAANKYTVYYGTTKSPSIVKSGLVDAKTTVEVADGVTYYWKVETIDANGIVTTSPLFSFTAINGSNPKFTVSLSCKTDVLTSIGVDLKADDVVDLRFLILKKTDLSVDTIIDAAKANEIFREFAILPDGDYVIAVDIASTINAGDLNTPINLSLSLNFFQKGIINTTYEYPNVMTNAFNCSSYRTNIATVKKVGSQYTTERVISEFVDHSSDHLFAGIWKGEDADPSWASEITASMVDGKLLFDGIGRGWMQDVKNGWGESIKTQTPISFVMNYCNGTFVIPNQLIMNTIYKSKDQIPYYIEGTGSFDLSGKFPVINIHYDFIQDGQSIAFYFGAKTFDAKVTLDPAGFAAVKQLAQLKVKPLRR